jgi:hypothetical protein
MEGEILIPLSLILSHKGRGNLINFLRLIGSKGRVRHGRTFTVGSGP